MENVGFKSFATILSGLFLWLIYYLKQPVLSIGYIGGFMFIGLVIYLIILNVLFWIFDFSDEAFSAMIIGIAVYLIIIVFVSFISSSCFHASFLHHQIGTPTKIEYSEMIKQIDNSQIPIVDEKLARKQADKKIGEDIALGSRVELGDAAIQEVNGEIMWVVPLEHTGLWKWNANRSTPGYITVSASNPNKVNFVTQLGDEKINILYQNSAFFSHNLKRHIRNQGFRTIGLTEYTFEIDDTGRPYWVVTTYKNRTIWFGSEATGVVIVDAQTGETKWYSVEETPDWVDIIQPKYFIENQIDNYGKLVNGFWNTLFGKRDMTMKTDLLLTVYVNGDCYYFTGMTSVGTDNSCVGFIMVNTRDKKSEICYMTGATESAAMSSAEGLVSNFGYKSTEPLPINVNGIPTYVMALKDEEGLIKSYAMVNIQNYNISAKGTSIGEASRSYIQAVARESKISVVSSDEAYGYTCEGKVQRISDVVENGSTYYYIIIEGEDGKIFTASYSVSDELPITREGDDVKLDYIDDSNGTVDVISFDNKVFSTSVSEDQKKRDELDEGTSAFDSKYNEIVEVNPELNEEKWNSLTEEEKAKLIEEFLKTE